MYCASCGQPVKKADKTRCSVCDGSLHKDCALTKDNQNYCDNCYAVDEQSPNLPQSFTIPEVIRRSYIETYRACPYKFYREVLMGETADENGIHAQIGIDLHELFGKACLENPNYTKEHMTDEFRPIWNNYEAGKFSCIEQQSELLSRSKECITRFYEILPSFPHRAFAIEEKLEFAVGDLLPKISTTLDRVDRLGDELHITDWKTGKVMVGEKLSSDLQAPLYIYGAQEKYGMPVKSFRFIYLQDGKERLFTRIENSNTFVCTVRKRDYFISPDAAVKEVQSVFGRIMNGDFNIPQDVKKMYFHCKMCHLQEQKKCQGADVQSWYNTQKTGTW